MGVLKPFEIKQRLNEAVDKETKNYTADSRINNTNAFSRERKLTLKK